MWGCKIGHKWLTSLGFHCRRRHLKKDEEKGAIFIVQHCIIIWSLIRTTERFNSFWEVVWVVLMRQVETRREVMWVNWIKMHLAKGSNNLFKVFLLFQVRPCVLLTAHSNPGHFLAASLKCKISPQSTLNTCLTGEESGFRCHLPSWICCASPGKS